MKMLVVAVLLVLSTTVCKYTYYTERRTSKHNNSHMLSTIACKYQLCTRGTLLHTGIYRRTAAQTKKANPELPFSRFNIVHHDIAYVLVNLKIYCCYELL